MAQLNAVEWAIRPLKKYAVFSGRASRAEYWWFSLATAIVQIPLTMIDGALGDWSPFSTLFSLAILLPSLAVTVRRLHDTDRSGWWLLAPAVPYLIGAVLFIPAMMGAPSAMGMAAGLGIAGLFLGIGAILAIVVLVFMCLRGTPGPNRFGDDPYGDERVGEVFA